MKQLELFGEKVRPASEKAKPIIAKLPSKCKLGNKWWHAGCAHLRRPCNGGISRGDEIAPQSSGRR